LTSERTFDVVCVPFPLFRLLHYRPRVTDNDALSRLLVSYGMVPARAVPGRLVSLSGQGAGWNQPLGGERRDGLIYDVIKWGWV